MSSYLEHIRLNLGEGLVVKTGIERREREDSGGRQQRQQSPGEHSARCLPENQSKQVCKIGSEESLTHSGHDQRGYIAARMAARRLRHQWVHCVKGDPGYRQIPIEEATQQSNAIRDVRPDGRHELRNRAKFDLAEPRRTLLYHRLTRPVL